MRDLFGDRYVVYSAGTEATFVKPPVPIVLSEIGIDPSSLWSKTTSQLDEPTTDIVVTVCDDAVENCPFRPARERTIHRAFSDPSSKGSSPEENLEAFRKTRDEIRTWLIQTFS